MHSCQYLGLLGDLCAETVSEIKPGVFVCDNHLRDYQAAHNTVVVPAKAEPEKKTAWNISNYWGPATTR